MRTCWTGSSGRTCGPAPGWPTVGATKSNEIPAVRHLLTCFDLTGVVVTVDAMHTQTDTATAITGAGGDYVFTVKKNQPSLHAACKALPWKAGPGSSCQQPRARSSGHPNHQGRSSPGLGRLRRRHPGRASATHLTRAEKKSVEVIYLITSADHQAAPPATLAAWIQGHWGIENRLHWVRDVSFDEDRSQVRTANAPQVIATVRNTSISLLRLTGWTNIAAALQHHAAHPDQAIECRLTC